MPKPDEGARNYYTCFLDVEGQHRRGRHEAKELRGGKTTAQRKEGAMDTVSNVSYKKPLWNSTSIRWKCAVWTNSMQVLCLVAEAGSSICDRRPWDSKAAGIGGLERCYISKPQGHPFYNFRDMKRLRKRGWNSRVAHHYFAVSKLSRLYRLLSCFLGTVKNSRARRETLRVRFMPHTGPREPIVHL